MAMTESATERQRLFVLARVFIGSRKSLPKHDKDRLRPRQELAVSDVVDRAGVDARGISDRNIDAARRYEEPIFLYRTARACGEGASQSQACRQRSQARLVSASYRGRTHH